MVGAELVPHAPDFRGRYGFFNSTTRAPHRDIPSRTLAAARRGRGRATPSLLAAARLADVRRRPDPAPRLGRLEAETLAARCRAGLDRIANHRTLSLNATRRARYGTPCQLPLSQEVFHHVR